MISRVTIYFENEKLRRDFEIYSKEHGKSFSETVLEFAGAGFSLFQKMGSLNVELLIERVNRLDEAKREIEFLRKIIDARLLQESLSPTKRKKMESRDRFRQKYGKDPRKFNLKKENKFEK
jgi:hypothetical protein